MRPMPELKITTEKLDDLMPYAANAKMHPRAQIEQIAESIKRFGNCDPIGVWHNADGEMEIVEGHGRLSALKLLGAEECPVIYLDHLTDAQRRAYALAHNQLTMTSGFDPEALMAELGAIEFTDMSRFGFDSEPMTADDIDALLASEEQDSIEEHGMKTVVCPYCGYENVVEE